MDNTNIHSVQNHVQRTQGKGTTASPGETSLDSRAPSDLRSSKADPRTTPSTTETDSIDSRGTARDASPHEEMNSAHSGNEPQDKDPKAKGNIHNPDPDKPDPTGVPSVQP